MSSAAGKIRDDRLGRPGGLQIAGVIREAYDRVRVPDIHVSRVVTGRVKGNPEVLTQTSGKDFLLLGLAVWRRATKYEDLPTFALRNEKVSIRSSFDFPRLVHAAGILLDFEPGQSLWPGVRRFRDQRRRVCNTLRRERLWQIRDSNLAKNAGMLALVIGKRCPS